MFLDIHIYPHLHMFTCTLVRTHTGAHVLICELYAHSHTHKITYRILSNRSHGL